MTRTYSFEIHELSDAPSYVCISYTWGAPERKPGEAANAQTSLMNTGSLLVDGNHHDVSRNVLDIMSRVMERGDVERMWVDSLCINQFDLVERSSQVSIMGEIYQAADVVVVWLRQDERNEFSQVEEICQAIQAMLHPKPGWCHREDFQSLRTRNEGAIGIIIHYRRFMTKRAVTSGISAKRLEGPRLDGRVRTDCMRLWTHLLENFKAFDATDDRDYVYATLGIIKAIAAHHSLDMPEIIVEYTQPVARVYADATEKIMKAGGCANLLCLAQDPQTRNGQDLPSWVPEFIGENHEELTNYGFWEQTARILLSRRCFSSDVLQESRLESLWRTMIANTSLDDDAIAPAEVAGYFKAFMITSLVTKLMHDSNHLDNIPSWKELTAIEQKLATGRDEENANLLGLEELLVVSAEVDRRWTAIEAGGPVPPMNPVASRAIKFVKATKLMFYCRIILTKEGYLGLGPRSTCPGDLVWVMPGSPLPTILRNKSADGADTEKSATERFTLIGETYLRGNPDFKPKTNDVRWIELE
ncbi:heterokaryon incompatibility protein-domain-containing protein [Xylaria sp. FL1042]|nr:heterokaryon incompatibility protein-domain-containing protein [Xylaria sp. FL1042]